MIPIKNAIISFITPVAVIAACVSLGYTWVLSAKTETLETQNAALHVVNEQNSLAIGAVIELRAMNTRILAALDRNRKILEARDRDTHQKLAELAAVNESVKNYLRNPVPDDVRRLLLDAQLDKRGGNGGQPNSDSDPAVPTSGVQPSQ